MHNCARWMTSLARLQDEKSFHLTLALRTLPNTKVTRLTESVEKPPSQIGIEVLAPLYIREVLDPRDPLVRSGPQVKNTLSIYW